MADSIQGLDFLRQASRPSLGLMEVRGPFYSTFGPGYLDDYLTTVGSFVDWVKMPAPSLMLLAPDIQERFVRTCHDHGVKIAAGGAIEWVVTRGAQAVDTYFDTLAALGYDVVEVSAGMLALPDQDFVRLIRRAQASGMTVKAEVGVQFGAGGTSSEAELARAGSLPISWALARAHAALEAGAEYIVLESEGVTESVSDWRTDVPAAFVADLGVETVIFEAADPAVFSWYIKTFGPGVNLFVDHSQALHLESIRSGVWGTTDLWGRVATYAGDQAGVER